MYLVYTLYVMSIEKSNHTCKYLGSKSLLSLQAKLNKGHLDGEGISRFPLPCHLAGGEVGAEGIAAGGLLAP